MKLKNLIAIAAITTVLSVNVSMADEELVNINNGYIGASQLEASENIVVSEEDEEELVPIYYEVVNNDDSSELIDAELENESENIEITDKAIKVIQNGEYISFTDNEGKTVNPQIINNRTMVPMRAIFEKFGMQVNWNADTKTVTGKNDKAEITLVIGNPVVKVKDLTTNDEKEITLDQAATIVDNRTLVPVRFIAETLNKEVGWDSDNRTVVIIDDEALVELLKKEFPILQKIFDLKLENVTSMSSNATLTGALTYYEDNKKQDVKINGSAVITIDNSNMDLAFKAKLTGTATEILENLKQNGYDSINLKIALRDNKIYYKDANNENAEWTQYPMTQTTYTLGETTTTLDSYEDFLAYVKAYAENIAVQTNTIKAFTTGNYSISGDTAVQALSNNATSNISLKDTAYSYAYIQSAIDYLKGILNEECISITNDGKNINIVFNYDSKDFLGTEVPVDATLKITENYKNNKFSNGKVELNFEAKDSESSESVSATLNMDVEAEKINEKVTLETI